MLYLKMNPNYIGGRLVGQDVSDIDKFQIIRYVIYFLHASLFYKHY